MNVCTWKRLFLSFVSLVNMNSKPENRVRTENSVDNNNEPYKNIRKAAEENVADTLAARRQLLELAVFCVIESIRKDPDKYDNGNLSFNS